MHQQLDDGEARRYMSLVSDAVSRQLGRWRRLRNQSDDIVQEIWLRLLKSPTHLQEMKQPAAYISTLTHNLLCHQYREAVKKQMLSITPAIQENTSEDRRLTKGTTESNDNSEIERILREGAKIDPVASTILNLRLDGYSNMEIADSVGLSQNEVRIRLSHLAKRIRFDSRD